MTVNQLILVKFSGFTSMSNTYLVFMLDGWFKVKCLVPVGPPSQATPAPLSKMSKTESEVHW